MHIPLIKNTGKYTLDRARKDIIAAVIVTAIAIPESLGFAAIVGVPVQNGLYCALLAPIFYALFASSRRLIVGADSATASIVAGGAALVAVAGTVEYANAVIVLGLLTALGLVLMGIFRMGFFADLISRPVLMGFMAGVGLQLMLDKLPEMLGIETHGHLLNKVWETLAQLGQMNMETVILSIAVLASILYANKFRLPGPLIGLVVGTLLTWIFHLDTQGVKLIGEIPAGLPQLTLPNMNIEMILTLIPAALSIAIVILAQSTAVARTFASKHDEKIKDNQDLVALGVANAASAVTGGFAVNGSPPRTTAADISGGSSQLVNVYMSLLVGAVLLFATGLIAYVPVAALATVVFSIGLHLIDVKRLEDVYVKRRVEFFIAMAAMIGVAVLGVRTGVLFAVIASLVERLHRQYHPDDAILLRDRKLDETAAQRLHSKHQFSNHPSGVLVYQFKGSLFFENTSYFKQRLWAAIDGAENPVQYFVLDAASVNDIDYTAAHAIKHIILNLRSDDVQFCMSHVSPGLRSKLDEYELSDLMGAQYIYPTLNDAFIHLASLKHSTVDKIRWLDIAKKNYVVIGGAAMELRGLRKTNDVDVVVADSVYRHYKDNHRWKEFVSDDGKRTLWHEGYVIMTKWVGKDLADLKRNAEDINGIPVISVKDQIAAKRILGRRKDLKDIKLLENLNSRPK